MAGRCPWMTRPRPSRRSRRSRADSTAPAIGGCFLRVATAAVTRGATRAAMAAATPPATTLLAAVIPAVIPAVMTAVTTAATPAVTLSRLQLCLTLSQPHNPNRNPSPNPNPVALTLTLTLHPLAGRRAPLHQLPSAHYDLRPLIHDLPSVDQVIGLGRGRVLGLNFGFGLGLGCCGVDANPITLTPTPTLTLTTAPITARPWRPLSATRTTAASTPAATATISTPAWSYRKRPCSGPVALDTALASFAQEPCRRQRRLQHFINPREGRYRGE